jgi:hypothetical protein
VTIGEVVIAPSPTNVMLGLDPSIQGNHSAFGELI